MKLHNFLDFCNNKSLNDINIFLKLGNNLESIVDNDGFNALQSACVLNYEDIIEILIDHGFDVNVLLTYDEIIHSYIFDKHQTSINENIYEDIFNERKYHNSRLTLFDLCNTKISDKTKVEMCRKILIEKGLQLDMRYVDYVANKITNIDEFIRKGSRTIYWSEKQHELNLFSIKVNCVKLLQSNNNKMIFYAVEKNNISCIKKICNPELIHYKIVDGDGNNLLHVTFKILNNHLDKNSEKHDHVKIIDLLMTRIKLSLTNNFNETPFDMISEENHFKFMELLIDHNEEKDLLRKFQLWKQLKKDKEERDYRVFTESKINELCDRVKSLESMLDTEKNVDKFEDDRKLRKINRLDH